MFRHIAMAISFVLLGIIFIPSSANAKQPECRVENEEEKTFYNSNTHSDPLQSAITEAASGDTLKVIGTCRGNYFIYQNITLTGRESHKHNDTLDGGGSGTVLSIGAHIFPVTVEIAHLVITNGYSSLSGGGIEIGPAATVTLSDSKVTGNVADGYLNYGGINNSGYLTLIDSIISDNKNGGIASHWGASLRLINSSVNENQGGLWGGGIHSGRGTYLELQGSTVANNRAATGGGISGHFAYMWLYNSFVTGNISTHSAGGIYNWDSDLLIEDSVVSDNESTNTKIGGGGIYNQSVGGWSFVELINTSVVGNRTFENGGGILNTGFKAALYIGDSTVTSNVAVEGGGIYSSGGASVDVYGNNALCGNSPDDWPGCDSP